MVTLTRIKELIDSCVVRRFLVIAPKRVAEATWSTEAAKWDHLQGLVVQPVIGSAESRRLKLRKNADVYVISRDNVKWLVEGLKGQWPFDGVVIDELTSFKNTTTKRWRHLKRVIGSSDYVIGLTGEPVPNGYYELWAQLYLIDRGEALGRTITAYRDKYFRPGRRNGQVIFEWILQPGAKQKIDDAIRPFCLSMSKEDWLQLPPIIYNEVKVRMCAAERKIYDQLVKDKVLPLLEGEVSSLDDMDSAVVGGTAAVLSNKLLQMANGAVYDENGDVFKVHDHKLEALQELYESNGDNLLVFYQYRHDLDKIREWFPDARVLEGPQEIDDWNAGKIKMLLCHPASAAFGLNLQQGGRTVVWFGLPWSLELHDQANARLYRQGQEHPVIVHYIMCEYTLDEKVLAVLQQKDAVQRSMLDALKTYVSEKKEGK